MAARALSLIHISYLAGFDIVRDCMHNDTVRGFMNKMLHEEIIDVYKRQSLWGTFNSAHAGRVKPIFSIAENDNVYN